MHFKSVGIGFFKVYIKKKHYDDIDFDLQTPPPPPKKKNTTVVTDRRKFDYSKVAD